METTAAPKVVLAALRRARLRRRTEQVDLFEVLYQAYLATVLSGVAVLYASDIVGDNQVSTDQLAGVRHGGAAAVGIGLAVVFFAACRSGGQGGPLALERADVVHLLLSPLDRRLVLRKPALARLRSTAGFWAAAGAGIGVVASHRLPGAAAPWIASGALAGLTTGAMATGSAMVVSGTRVRRTWATAAGLAVVVWSVADLVAGRRTSPLTMVGQLALWPARSPGPVAVVLLAAALLVAVAGVLCVGGISLEAAERRSGLVGQLRFAATVRDLRTVVLLHRQLAQERPRSRPWLRLRPGSRLVGAVWKRDWQGLLRWPIGRVLRSVALGAGAGLALRGMWTGTTALVLVGGVALWLVALDAVEGLAQEADHSELARGIPVWDGFVLVRHLPAAAVAVLLSTVPAVLAALPGNRAGLVVPLGLAVAGPAALCAVAGAAISTARGPVNVSDPMSSMMPEVAGIGMVLRETLPPAVVTAGLLPLLAARQAAEAGRGPVAAAVGAAVTLVVPVAFTVWWLSRKQLVQR